MSAEPLALANLPEFVDPATFTPRFAWRRAKASKALEEVHAEGVGLGAVAKTFGTPVYLYSAAAIDDALGELRSGLGNLPHTVCFAVKANGNLSILKRLLKLGSGFDIVSGGELEHLGRIGVPGGRIVFSGVGKSREEIRSALEYPSTAKRARSKKARGILLFNIESEPELDTLLEEAATSVRRGNTAPSCAIRVNPDVEAGGHPHIATGRYHHKFGLPWAEARRLYLEHKASPFIRWRGISAHIGSQILSLDPFRRAFERVAGYVRELRAADVPLRYLDFGGGLGVRYTSEATATREEYARMVAGVAGPLGLHLLLEPGRALVAAAGVLLTRVLYTKQSHGKRFVVVDAAMNDLLRPALYSALHPITRIRREGGDSGAGLLRADIVGPVCETGDCFVRDWPIGEVRPGEVLAIWVAGSYGTVLASNYNGRTRPPEVLVDGRKAKLIRRRETQDDVLRTDVLGRQRQR